MDPFSDAGPGVGGAYSFTVAARSPNVFPFPWYELNSSNDPDLSGFGVTQNSRGPFNAVTDNDVITSPASVAPGDCAEVFVRANTCTSGDCNNPGNHPGNRLWTNVAGTTNPYGAVSITGTIPAGYSFTLSCTNDDVNAPIDCTNGGYATANIFHGASFNYSFVAPTANPPLFLILDEDAIDNGLKPNKFGTKDVNDDIAKLGQRRQLRWFADNVGAEIVLWSGQMGDEGWFAPKFIPQSWADTGPTDDGLRNFLGLPVGPGLGAGPGDKEKYLDKIPDVTPLRAEGLFMLIGRTVCAVVYDSDISINYKPLNGSLKGANLGIVAFTVTNVEQLFGQSSKSLPKVTLTVEDADEVCAGTQELFLDAPVPLTSSTLVDIVPGDDG